jgi:hypothetical protein
MNMLKGHGFVRRETAGAQLGRERLVNHKTLQVNHTQQQIQGNVAADAQQLE